MTNETAPALASQPPKVIWWFKVYCGLLCFLYLATAACSLFFFLDNPADAETLGAARFLGAAMLVVGLVFLGVCLVPLVLRPRPWLWTYDLVVICLGMTSACILPASLPLLIFWLKPEVKQYFGRS